MTSDKALGVRHRQLWCPSKSRADSHRGHAQSVGCHIKEGYQEGERCLRYLTTHSWACVQCRPMVQIYLPGVPWEIVGLHSREGAPAEQGKERW
jgi:hypothetical protein